MFAAIVGKSPLMCEKCRAEYMTRDNTRQSLKKWGGGGERNLLICRVLKKNLRNQESLTARRRRRDFIWPNADLFHTSAWGLCIILTDVRAGTELRRPILKCTFTRRPKKKKKAPRYKFRSIVWTFVLYQA